MSAPARRVATGRKRFGSPGLRRWHLADAAAILALLALVALAFLPVYGTPWLFVTVLGFGAVGIGIGVLAHWLHLGAGPIGLLGLAAWFLLGGFLAMPSSTVGYVVPTGRTLYGLLLGPVTAWRDMLTLEPPIGETFNLLTVPGVVALVAALWATLISLRGRRPTLAWLPIAGAYLAGVVVGSQVGFRPFLVGAAFFLIVLLWTSYRRAVGRRALSDTKASVKPVRMALGLAMLLAAGGLTAAIVPALADSPERATVRSLVEPPINLDQYASPLQGFRANISQRENTALFEVSGAREGDIVRIATLDKYNGLSYRVSTLDDEAVEATTFTRVGQWIDEPLDGEDREFSVVVRSYSGVWVPTVGQSTEVRFEGERRVALGENFFYNQSSGTGLTSVGLQEGDRYRLGARVAPRPSEDEIERAEAGDYDLPAMNGLPNQVLTKAHQWADGASSSGAAALIIENELRQGYYSNGQDDESESLPGHTQSRLNDLLSADNMVGDEEQYAVIMALMAREMGIPARVIYGFEVGQSPTVTGADVGAWPELYFQDLGWVVFDPTPPEDRILEEEATSVPPTPQRYIENPPPPPLRPEVPPADEQLPVDPGEPPVEETEIDWAQLGALFALTGIPLLTIVVPVALIIGLKLRRRARRRNDPVMANRIAGAWAELVDKARDVGRSPSISATRSEQAAALIEDFPKVRAVSDPVALAKEADWIVFAPGEPSQETTESYWKSSTAIRRGMRKSTNAVRWLASALSTKSFRKIR